MMTNKRTYYLHGLFMQRQT